MSKIFISQPMNGKTNEEIENKRNYIIDRLATQFARENECIDIIYSFFSYCFFCLFIVVLGWAFGIFFL